MTWCSHWLYSVCVLIPVHLGVFMWIYMHVPVCAGVPACVHVQSEARSQPVMVFSRATWFVFWDSLIMIWGSLIMLVWLANLGLLSASPALGLKAYHQAWCLLGGWAPNSDLHGCVTSTFQTELSPSTVHLCYKRFQAKSKWNLFLICNPLSS